MSLPRDFDWFDHVVGEGMAHPRGTAGVNDSGRFGNQFVKRVDPPEHIVEPGISHFLTAAGVRHPPVAYSFRGDHIVHAPYLPGKPLSRMTDEDVAHPSVTKDSVLHTLTAEWLGAVADRHSGNYLFHPDHGIVPIDFGLTGRSPKGGWGNVFLHPHKEIVFSGLLQLARDHLDLKRSDPLPADALRHMRSVASELRSRYRTALSGYPKDHAQDHMNEFDRRLKHLFGPDAPPNPTLAHLLDFS